MTRGHLLGPGLLLAVLAVALVVGSGAFDAPAPGVASRISALEHVVRAPSTTDLSVAQNNAPSSIAIRDQITSEVRAGRTDAQVLTDLRTRYGTSILLVPPSSGIGIVLWVVPVALAGIAVATGVLVVWRRRSG